MKHKHNNQLALTCVAITAVACIMFARANTVIPLRAPAKPSPPSAASEPCMAIAEPAELVTAPTETVAQLADELMPTMFTVTAYCPCAVCCGDSADGITATGTVATQGRTVAVDPFVIPLGSTVVIDGHEYIAEDVGGAVDGNRVEIYFDSHEDALLWGRQSKR